MDLAQQLPLWQVALYGAGTFLLSLLLSKRSQVDAWVEAWPRLAGAMKILRGAGIDPWLIVQGVVLIFTGKLPASLRPKAADRETPTDPPRKPPSAGAGGSLTSLALACLSLVVLWSCTSAGPPAGPPCDQATLAGIVAECSTRAVAECKDVPDEECQALKDCDKRLDDRAEKCR